MHVSVDAEHCERSGECIALAPEVFSRSADGQTEAIAGDVPSHQEEPVRTAVQFCPRLAITVLD
jgi:ferredoxin